MNNLKKTTTSLLSNLGIEVSLELPEIESLSEVNPRTATEIAQRLCALTYVIPLGFDVKGEDLTAYLNQYNLISFVSEYESKMLTQEKLQEQDKVNMTWLPDAAQALAWCIGLVELNHFQPCDDDLSEKIPLRTDPNSFIDQAKLRPIKEIQAQSDLLYRMHWYAKNCDKLGKEYKFSKGIVYERRKAIDWAYGVEENWDDVPMDT